MRQWILAATIALSASPAWALTGAELLQSDDRYARGYLWGARSSYLILVSPDDIPTDDAKRANRLACLQQAKITDGTFHQAVVGYINRNPRALTEDAMGPMIRTLIEMCDGKN